MPATNNELEFLVQRARTEKLDPARLSSGGAETVGVALVWDGTNWVPGIPAIDESANACKDLDLEPILDLDGQPCFEPGDDAGGGTWVELDVFIWDQVTPSTLWNMTHGRGKKPINVQVFDSSGNEVTPTVQNPTDATTWARWGYPATGQARILFN